LDEPIHAPTLDEFLACCQAECEFLVLEYGFERLAVPLEHNSYSMRFRKGEFEVHVYGENYGQTASCDLVRGGDRLSLGLLVPAAERQKKTRKRVRLGQLDQVRGIATRLTEHASDFLRGDSSRFDSALAEWKRVTRPRPLTDAQRAERRRQEAVAAAGHASKRADYAEVVRLLQPHVGALSRHQRRMLDAALGRLGNEEV
jgi:hypothetical protein